MSDLYLLLRIFFNRSSGATAAEYAIMVALIAMVIFAAVTALGLSVNGLFQSAVDTMPEAGTVYIR